MEFAKTSSVITWTTYTARARRLDFAKESLAQPLAGEWTYQMKNRLERRLRKMVCSGALDLKVAQQKIARDWIGLQETPQWAGPGAD